MAIPPPFTFAGIKTHLPALHAILMDSEEKNHYSQLCEINQNFTPKNSKFGWTKDSSNVIDGFFFHNYFPFDSCRLQRDKFRTFIIRDYGVKIADYQLREFGKFLKRRFAPRTFPRAVAESEPTSEPTKEFNVKLLNSKMDIIEFSFLDTDTVERNKNITSALGINGVELSHENSYLYESKKVSEFYKNIKHTLPLPIQKALRWEPKPETLIILLAVLIISGLTIAKISNARAKLIFDKMPTFPPLLKSNS
ncbi:MAG: hypothetical protein K1060chlam2_00911 [Chlamydiae bacterium]|nr:hypothetical protein [Chlamydiota bacterium]